MRRKKPRKAKTNRGGTVLEYDGITFKSKLEVYCYQQLKEHGLEAAYEVETFEILPSITFIYNDKKSKVVRSMNYTPDFVGDDYIIECKGYASESFPLRWKIFKHFLYNNNIKKYLYLPRKKADIDEMIQNILKIKAK
jgi:hypothetical protein